MSVTKSFRMKDKTLNMFNTIKEYYSYLKKVSETEIIVMCISSLYQELVKDLDSDFIKSMSDTCLIKDADLIPVFEKICNFLNVSEINNGTSLKTEFRTFLDLNRNGDESGKTSLNDEQYIRIWEMVTGDMKTEEAVTVLEDLYRVYEEIK